MRRHEDHLRAVYTYKRSDVYLYRSVLACRKHIVSVALESEKQAYETSEVFGGYLLGRG